MRTQSLSARASGWGAFSGNEHYSYFAGFILRLVSPNDDFQLGRGRWNAVLEIGPHARVSAAIIVTLVLSNQRGWRDNVTIAN